MTILGCAPQGHAPSEPRTLWRVDLSYNSIPAVKTSSPARGRIKVRKQERSAMWRATDKPPDMAGQEG